MVCSLHSVTTGSRDRANVPLIIIIMEMSKLTRDGTAEPSRETKFSDANADREILFFPVQLTTSRIDNLTGLIHTLAICVTIHKPNIRALSGEIMSGHNIINREHGLDVRILIL